MHVRSIELLCVAWLIILPTAIQPSASAQCGWSDTDPQWTPAGTVDEFAEFDDGNGIKLYAVGVINFAGNTSLAVWDGRRWSAMAASQPIGGDLLGIATFDDGNGDALYVAGLFDDIGATSGFNNIAKYDGSTWSPVGGGLEDPFGITLVTRLLVHDDGSGPALFACGIFGFGGTTPARNIAKWNGTTWSPLGSGIDGSSGVPIVNDMIVYDDGQGPALYATGQFDTAGGSTATAIAKWDGSSWSPLAFGLQGPFGVPVGQALATFQGAGHATESLYVVGDFDQAIPTAVTGIARWDGTSWHAVEFPATVAPPTFRGLATLTGSDGTYLYATGWLDTALGSGIFRFDGYEWLSVGGGLGSNATGTTAMTAYRGDLFFGVYNSAVSSGVARWESGTTTYGSGTAGMGGLVPHITTNGAIPKGGSGFQIVVTGGVGGGSGLLFFGDAPTATPQPWGTLLVGGIGGATPIALGGAPGVAGAGTGSLPINLPPHPIAFGHRYFQAILSDSSATGGFSQTGGLRINPCGLIPTTTPR